MYELDRLADDGCPHGDPSLTAHPVAPVGLVRDRPDRLTATVEYLPRDRAGSPPAEVATIAEYGRPATPVGGALTPAG